MHSCYSMQITITLLNCVKGFSLHFRWCIQFLFLGLFNLPTYLWKQQVDIDLTTTETSWKDLLIQKRWPSIGGTFSHRDVFLRLFAKFVGDPSSPHLWRQHQVCDSENSRSPRLIFRLLHLYVVPHVVAVGEMLHRRTIVVLYWCSPTHSMWCGFSVPLSQLSKQSCFSDRIPYRSFASFLFHCLLRHILVAIIVSERKTFIQAATALTKS